jgi:hypothetical protein
MWQEYADNNFEPSRHGDRSVRVHHSLYSAFWLCVSITLPKRQPKLPDDHQAVRDSRGGVSDRCGPEVCQAKKSTG